MIIIQTKLRLFWAITRECDVWNQSTCCMPIGRSKFQTDDYQRLKSIAFNQNNRSKWKWPFINSLCVLSAQTQWACRSTYGVTWWIRSISNSMWIFMVPTRTRFGFRSFAFGVWTWYAYKHCAADVYVWRETRSRLVFVGGEANTSFWLKPIASRLINLFNAIDLFGIVK